MWNSMPKKSEANCNVHSCSRHCSFVSWNRLSTESSGNIRTASGPSCLVCSIGLRIDESSSYSNWLCCTACWLFVVIPPISILALPPAPAFLGRTEPIFLWSHVLIASSTFWSKDLRLLPHRKVGTNETMAHFLYVYFRSAGHCCRHW